MPAPVMNRAVADFTAEATGGKTVRLKDLRGSKVVLYFYPKDNTPGCTTEGQDFRKLYPQFKRNAAVVYGISKDSMASHEKFKDKFGFPFDLISDPDESLCRHFDVIREKTLYGRKFMGIERSSFLIDAEGTLKGEWRKVKVAGHAKDVLDAVKNC
ncbi:MAG: peroxiredoxin [Nevskiales bacterium]